MAAIERAGAAADEQIDAAGRCVIPGFVDSHTHLVFAGDRADEFAARMAGRPYAASGIRVTTEATRAASEDELAPWHAPGAARRCGPASPTSRSSPGYGLEPEAERALVRRRGRADRRRDLPRSARRPARVRGPRGRLRGARVRRDARRVPAATRAGSTCSARRAPSTPTSRAPCSRPAAPRASACACTATSSASGRACSSRSRWARRRSTTAPTCPTTTSPRSPASDTVATFLPATDFSTRQPYPDARRAIDAGVDVAIATNCNPGSSYTTSMAFCIALAVRDMRMTPEEALAGRHPRRRPRAAARRRRPARARRPRRRRDPRGALVHAPRLPPRRPARRRDRDRRDRRDARAGRRRLGRRRARAAAQRAAAAGRPRQLVRPGPRDAVDVDPVVEGRQDDLEPAVAVQVGDRGRRRDADAVSVAALPAAAACRRSACPSPTARPAGPRLAAAP